MDDEILNQENLMVETLEKYQLPDNIAELADVGLNEIANKLDVLVNIPYIRGIYGFVKAGGAFRDYFLIKKLLKFLTSINSVSEKEQIDMFWDLQNDSEKRIEIGQHIIAILDKAENIIKADMNGKLWKYYCLKKINSAKFLRLTMVVTNLITEDIKKLPTYNVEQKGKEYSAALHSMGLLVRTSGFENKPFEVEEDGYQLSSLGAELIELLEMQ